jgi:hypothetical protein
VLREASLPDDLTGYLDQDTLMAVWPELHLPKSVQAGMGRSTTRSCGLVRPDAGQ